MVTIQAILWKRGIPLRKRGGPESYTIVAFFHILVAVLVVIGWSPSAGATLVGYLLGLVAFASALLLMARRCQIG